ncbi:neuroplastin isoform X3, partial [Lates japonicus]
MSLAQHRTTQWTISPTSKDLSSAIRRGFFTAYGRTSASLSRALASSRTLHPSLSSRGLRRGDISKLVFGKSFSMTILKNPVLCWAHLSRSCDQYTSSPPHSSDRDPGTHRPQQMHPNAVMLAVVLLGNLMLLPFISAQNEPKINASDQTILSADTSGKPVTLQCNLTTAHTAHKDSFWMKNGQKIPNTQSDQKNTAYRITKPRADDSGEYMCVYTFDMAPNANATIEVKADSEAINLNKESSLSK